MTTAYTTPKTLLNKGTGFLSPYSQMVGDPPEFLLLQTRSPLVTRDIDLLLQLRDRVRVSLTIETDREEIRRAFTPYAPPIAARLRAGRLLAEAGVPVQATIAPVLPCSEQFPAKLLPWADRVCLDDYFMGDGSGGVRTGKLGLRSLYEELKLEAWYTPEAYRIVHERLLRVFPDHRVFLSQGGFAP